jgi:hypothetical protein
MCSDGAPPTGKEAPRQPQGLRWLPKWSSPTHRLNGSQAAHPLKGNQFPRVGSGVAKQWAQHGPPAQGSARSLLPDLWQSRVGPRGQLGRIEPYFYSPQRDVQWCPGWSVGPKLEPSAHDLPTHGRAQLKGGVPLGPPVGNSPDELAKPSLELKTRTP